MTDSPAVTPSTAAQARCSCTKAPTAPPATLFLFGANGDLVKRLLIPSLYNLLRDGLLDDRTQIIGNRELPKVLYIVPWKKPLPGDLSGRPLVSVLDEALAPVDRDVFRRQVTYDAQAQARVGAPAATPLK